MSEYQHRHQSEEETSPAVEAIRRNSPFQSNTRAFENSSRLEQLQHLRQAGAMCLPNERDQYHRDWWSRGMGLMSTPEAAEADHAHDHAHDHTHEEAAAEPAPIITPLDEHLPLTNGSRGDGVKLLQEKLNSLGASLGVDGSFGPASASAVEIFQVANGLPRTGEVDAATAAALYGEAPKALSDAQLEGVPGQFLGSFEAWDGGKRLEDVDVVELDGKKVAVKTARAWQTLRDAAAADGVFLQLNSGFRTMAEQRHLYQKYGSPRAAYPGHSNHQHGQALDIDASNPQHKRWLFENAPSFGWRNTVSFEPWHWEYFGN